MMLGVSPGKLCHLAPQQPQGLTMKSIGTVHAQMARPAQVNLHLELWLYSLITELEMGNGERGEIQAGVGGVMWVLGHRFEEKWSEEASKCLVVKVTRSEVRVGCQESWVSSLSYSELLGTQS